MPRFPVALALSTALAAGGALALESAARNQAEAQTPWFTARHAEAGGGNPGDPRPAPAWSNKSWLNTEQPLNLSSLRGKVVLLNFWVFT